MSFFVVDIEADGPIPGDYSMIEIGVVKVIEDIENAPIFYSPIYPISDKYDSRALESIGTTREITVQRRDAKPATEVMKEFEQYLIGFNEGSRPIFISDNNGFDWMFVCWYFHHFLGRNPFGWSSRRIGDLYCGMQKDVYARWKHLRKTKHTHNPVDDATGNAETIIYMKQSMGLKIGLK